MGELNLTELLEDWITHFYINDNEKFQSIADEIQSKLNIANSTTYIIDEKNDEFYIDRIKETEIIIIVIDKLFSDNPFIHLIKSVPGLIKDTYVRRISDIKKIPESFNVDPRIITRKIDENIIIKSLKK